MKDELLFKKLVMICSILILAALLSLPVCAQADKKKPESSLKRLVSHLHWLGHDAFRIESDKLEIYIDPFSLQPDAPKADLILITHDHHDHMSPADISKIRKTETVIVTTAKAAEKLKGDIKIIEPGDEITVKGISVKAVPAYNINKFRSPGVPFHPKESKGAGFIVHVNGVRIYHAGDTDFIPEMKNLAPDVALLPVSGIYVMTAEEAVRAASAIGPKVAVPMHVGGPVGIIKSAEEFKTRAKVPVIVLPIE